MILKIIVGFETGLIDEMVNLRAQNIFCNFNQDWEFGSDWRDKFRLIHFLSAVECETLSAYELTNNQWVRNLSSAALNEFVVWLQPQLSAKLWVHTNSLIINEFAIWVRLHSMRSSFKCGWVRDSLRSLYLRKYLTQRYGLRILIWVIQLNLESAESDQNLLNLDSIDSVGSCWDSTESMDLQIFILGKQILPLNFW